MSRFRGIFEAKGYGIPIGIDGVGGCLKMLKRLSFGFAVAMLTAAPLMAGPTLPAQAAERIPTSLLPTWAVQALCSYLGVGC